MLFNSFVFIFALLPVAVAGFALASRRDGRLGLAWLVAISLAFYAWWDVDYLPVLVLSIVANFLLGGALQRRPSRALLVLGVALNLGCIAYFKYAVFLTDNLHALTGVGVSVRQVLLPLGISFFTFQQIAYLVESYRGTVGRTDFLTYGLFVSFFPQLIAGPIVHFREMMPQFRERLTARFSLADLTVGISIFSVGLAKKMLIADRIAPTADAVFGAAAAGASVPMSEAWLGTLAYTLQLYFDFSGYSDMAIGAARMFGIVLPQNFNSPYKARNIIEFWRRWHITLSRFLREYLYFPLGGNRLGTARRYANLTIVMVLGGLWHGAGWTFVLWGALHGAMLALNHGWHALRRRLGLAGEGGWPGLAAARALTFLAVALGWVLFRAVDLEAAGRIYAGMAGMGALVPADGAALVARPAETLALLAGVLALAMWAPNTQQIFAAHRPALGWPEGARPAWGGVLAWRPNVVWGVAVAALIIICSGAFWTKSPFLYFQF
jgi:D-alanyl-lipoteichoic acid acyltransferase DltB (MBOAT superfamily)